MKKYWSHPTAVIDRPARIGEGTKIWHFCHVMAGARIGTDCVLGQNLDEEETTDQKLTALAENVINQEAEDAEEEEEEVEREV